MHRVRVGIIGCGDIARRAYVPSVRRFEVLDLVACADINLAAARQLGADLEIPRVLTVEALLAAEDVDLILNLTTPQAHAPVNLAILEADKHLYVEKPFALTREAARAVLNKAADKHLLVAAAPDTFLGAGLQTVRKVIDENWIGEPTAAAAFMGWAGPESWHPDPGFLYLEGAGPLLDMGPYYLTALVSLVGPVKRVIGMSKRTWSERTITSEPKYGQRIPVEVDTHVCAHLEFHSNLMATMTISYDVQKHNLPRFEIYGTEGTVTLHDPDTFGGPVRVYRSGGSEPAWQEMPLVSPYHGEHRGIGAADLAYAMTGSRPHRATGELATHVLDAMLAIDESVRLGRVVELETAVDRPAALPTGLRMGQLDN